VKNNKAFTLIEFLLAFTIAAAVLVVIYATFINGVNLNRRSQKFAKEYQDRQWCFELITYDLENMVNFFPAEVASKAGDFDFHGSVTQFSFLLPDEEGLKLVHYYLEEEKLSEQSGIVLGAHSNKNRTVTESTVVVPAKWFLVREERSLNVNMKKAEAQKDRIVSVNPKDFNLMYADTEPQSDQKKKVVWRDSWDKPYQPVGIKIRALGVEKNIFLPKSLTLGKQYET
jgi:hypothetical protein